MTQLRSALAIACLLVPALVQGVTFTVDRTDDAADTGPLDGVCVSVSGGCTLRAAIQQANALPGADAIELPAGTYVLTVAGRDEEDAATGDLDVNDTLTIMGAGTATTIIDGNAIDRVFDVLAQTDISRLTIRNGNPGAGPTGHHGGAIFNGDFLVLTDVVVTGNTAEMTGGGIANSGDLMAIDLTVSGNTAGTTGGGIDNMSTARLTNVTASGNVASAGGGIANVGDELALVNVTLSGNMASVAGGGLANGITATLENVTIAGNTAPQGGGINNVSSTVLSNVIVANNPGGDCAGPAPLTSGGHNLDGGSSCGLTGLGDLMNADPRLGPLQNNGGPTSTHALMRGSPAIDAGGDCPPPDTDQRGNQRPSDGNGDGTAVCDIGAYEVVRCPIAPTFDSVLCRLDQARQTVREEIREGTVRARLEAALEKAKAKAERGAELSSAGQRKRRVRGLIRKVRKQLAKFKKTLGSRGAEEVVSAEVRALLDDEADGLRQDLTTLRRSL